MRSFRALNESMKNALGNTRGHFRIISLINPDFFKSACATL
jgi:hypothetical protein